MVILCLKPILFAFTPPKITFELLLQLHSICSILFFSQCLLFYSHCFFFVYSHYLIINCIYFLRLGFSKLVNIQHLVLLLLFYIHLKTIKPFLSFVHTLVLSLLYSSVFPLNLFTDFQHHH